MYQDKENAPFRGLALGVRPPPFGGLGAACQGGRACRLVAPLPLLAALLGGSLRSHLKSPEVKFRA